MSAKNCVFIGLATFDSVYFMPKLPLEDEKIRATNFYNSTGGPAANAAITYGILGGTASIISPIGETIFGKCVSEELNKYSINIIDIGQNNINPTLASIAVTGLRGNRTVWSYVEAPAMVKIKVEIARTTMKNFDCCLWDGHYFEIANDLISNHLSKEAALIFDGGSWKKDTDRLLHRVDYAIVSSSFKPPNTSGIDDVFDFLSSFGIKYIAITSGKNPIQLSINGTRSSITPPFTSAVDTLAAGDVFHGAFAFYLNDGIKNFEEALRKAASVAARSCEFYGPRLGVIECYNHN
ncbi:MAG: PfkB family carbohydrate kinase [Methylorubrum rhodinum]|uniref:PfkB family carbohydrate kinase n=1 Tax=Methylorubrum rhodinum TaxID=29428 RepID=UPI003BAEFC48